MADITPSGGTRPKAVQTNSLNPPLVFANDAYDDTNDEAVEWVRYENMAPNPSTFTVAACTTTNSDATVTTSNSLANVKVGDGVSGTGIPVSTTVLSKGNGTFELSNNATASGTVTLTFTPPTYDASLMAIKKKYTMSGSELKLTVSIYVVPGTLTNDEDGDGTDDLTLTDLSSVTPVVTSAKVSLDSYLSQARVAPSS